MGDGSHPRTLADNIRYWKWRGQPGAGYSRLYLAVTPLAVRRWDGWRRWFVAHFGPGAVRSLGWRIWHRTTNRAKDTAAVLLGWCNHAPEADELRQGRFGGAGAQWRCQLRRHAPAFKHRHLNYVWWRDSDGKVTTEYDPIEEYGPRPPRWLRKRTMIRSLGNQRRFDRIIDADLRERAAARSEGK